MSDRSLVCASGVLPELYDQLRSLAELWFSDQPADHTLQPTALVHEAYLRLADRQEGDWNSRTHFYAVAARAMRHVLIDHARRRAAAKRGATWCRVTMAEADDHASTADIDLHSLNDAMQKLEDLNERQCRIVEMRFLAGLTIEQTADALSISPRTVKLDWRMARAWLMNELLHGTGR